MDPSSGSTRQPSLASEKTPRSLRLRSADAQGVNWAPCPQSEEGNLNLTWRGAIQSEDQRAAEKPWGQDPSKDRVMEILDGAAVLGRGARTPRTEQPEQGDPPTLPPASWGPAARTNFPAAEVGLGAGLEACPEPLRSSTYQRSTSAQPSPTLFLPLPRASISLRFLISLLSPPPFSL